MIYEGDVVEAIREGGRDSRGLPRQVPMIGRVYRVTSVYEMAYGLGCTLQGMNATPYNGYLLYVIAGYRRRGFQPESGWYFRKAAADEGFQELMEIIKQGGHIREITPVSQRR